jgi:hypothetical protein
VEPIVEAYRPPADGRLTARQVELYLAVSDRLRNAQRRTPEPAPGATRTTLSEVLESAAPDVSMGREVFGNGEEYLWVKERVLEAEAAALTARLFSEELALLSRTLADLRTRRDAAADEASRKLIGEQITSFESEADRTTRESREKEPDAIRANAKLLEPYRGRLATLQLEVDRAARAAGPRFTPRRPAPGTTPALPPPPTPSPAAR